MRYPMMLVVTAALMNLGSAIAQPAEDEYPTDPSYREDRGGEGFCDRKDTPDAMMENLARLLQGEGKAARRNRCFPVLLENFHTYITSTTVAPVHKQSRAEEIYKARPAGLTDEDGPLALVAVMSHGFVEEREQLLRAINASGAGEAASFAHVRAWLPREESDGSLHVASYGLILTADELRPATSHGRDALGLDPLKSSKHWLDLADRITMFANDKAIGNKAFRSGLANLAAEVTRLANQQPVPVEQLLAKEAEFVKKVGQQLGGQNRVLKNIDIAARVGAFGARLVRDVCKNTVDAVAGAAGPAGIAIKAGMNGVLVLIESLDQKQQPLTIVIRVGISLLVVPVVNRIDNAIKGPVLNACVTSLVEGAAAAVSEGAKARGMSAPERKKHFKQVFVAAAGAAFKNLVTKAGKRIGERRQTDLDREVREQTGFGVPEKFEAFAGTVFDTIWSTILEPIIPVG